MLAVTESGQVLEIGVQKKFEKVVDSDMQAVLGAREKAFGCVLAHTNKCKQASFHRTFTLCVGPIKHQSKTPGGVEINNTDDMKLDPRGNQGETLTRGRITVFKP